MLPSIASSRPVVRLQYVFCECHPTSTSGNSSQTIHRQLNLTKRSTLSKVRQPWHANNMSLQVLMGTVIRNSMERDGSRHWRDGPS